eukprot:CAMPEP_0183333846 /NCGR_PEP_ID=MMETSP0164_2-20130417/2625_1 /TAXON_ID=221442 /ORGANISM="Coccolithus pelagicus ssp braarudi, Strain PLY182g" /LENGTH=133 /DNA_ID=CAMNT_0025502863 /DNA_START=39 /DNA_END=441 /DNA_ORIENTATION=-
MTLRIRDNVAVLSTINAPHQWGGIATTQTYVLRCSREHTSCTRYTGPPPMLADAPTAAQLGLALHYLLCLQVPAEYTPALMANPPIIADARATVLLAPAAPPSMLADARATALFTLAALPPVLADACTTALLA